MPTSSSAAGVSSKFLRTRLGRIIRDIRRKIAGSTALEDRFGSLLDLVRAIRSSVSAGRRSIRYTRPRSSASARARPQTLRVRLQSLHCYADHRPKGGQFVLHAKALHGNPYDGHTLGPIIADLEKLTGVAASTATRATAANYGSAARSGGGVALVTRFDFPAFADLGLAVNARRLRTR